jgi:hypothetical protein
MRLAVLLMIAKPLSQQRENSDDVIQFIWRFGCPKHKLCHPIGYNED